MNRNVRTGALLLTAIAALALTGCAGTESPDQSGEKKMLRFELTLGGTNYQGEIDETNHAVSLILPWGTDLRSLAPIIAVSDKAAVVPASGTAQDFTGPVEYTVTAEDGSSQVYTARALALPSSPEAAISLAETAKAGVQTAASAADVPEGAEWVSQAAMDALNAAIAAAQAVFQNADAAQAEKTKAIAKLTEAIAVFNDAKQTGTKTEAADKTALNAAIATANTAKSGVVVNTDAANVPEGTQWVVQAALDAFNGAISAAETVAQNAGATQAEADTAVTALNAAVTSFNNAKQTGTKTETPVNKTALNAALETAAAAKSGIAVDTDAANVPEGTQWVSQAAMDALDAAIAAAQAVAQKTDAAQAEADTAVTALNAAVTTFNNAKQTGTKTETPVNKEALTTAITAAAAAKSGIVVNTNAANVPEGTQWVAQAAMAALDAAIATAQAVAQNAGATQAETDGAVTALNAAVTSFNNAKQAGTKAPPADKTALTAAIAAANTAKSGVVVNTNAANVAEGTLWVTQTAMNALNAAISAAQTVAQKAGATQAEADGAVTALNAAVTTFNNAKQTGTKVNKAELTAAIATANTTKSSIVVNTDAANVPVGTQWVTQTAMNALNTAIAVAEAVAQHANASQADVDAEALALNAAVTSFNAAKQQGTKPETNKTALSAAIAAATAAKSGVVVNTNAANVPEGTQWVVQTAMDALNAAISAAQTIVQNADATQAEVDGAVTPLNNAVETFNAAKQQGTKPAPAAPAAPSITEGDSRLTLSWAAVTEATAYEVWHGATDNSGAAVKYGEDVTGLTAAIESLANGVIRYVWIKAKNSAGMTSGFSPSAHGTPRPDPGALGVTIAFVNGIVAVTGDQGTNTITKGGDPDSLVLRVAGFTDFHWSVDGSSTLLTANPLVLNAAYYETRKHSVTFYGIKDGVPYSRIVDFTVAEQPGIARVGPVSAADLAAALAWLPVGTAEAPSIVALDSSVDINSDTWGTVVAPALADVEKYITLDLSACVATGNTISGGRPPTANDDFNVIRRANNHISGIILPAALTQIGSYALAEWASLRKVVIPSGVTAIGTHAFLGCTGLTGVTLPEGLLSIGYGAFENCSSSSFTGITIPASVTSIDARVFNCANLARVTFEGNSAVLYSASSGGTSHSFHNLLDTLYNARPANARAGTYVYSAGTGWAKE
jgi:hypothetical protein